MPYLYEAGYAPASALTSDSEAPIWRIQGFIVTEPAQMFSCRFQHPAETSWTVHHPDILQMWDLTNNALLASFDPTTVTWPGTTVVAWVEFRIPTPVDLAPGVLYGICEHIPAGSGWSFQSGNPLMSADSSAPWYQASGPAGTPNAYSGKQSGSGAPLLASITWESTFRTGVDGAAFLPGTTPSDVDTSLSNWLVATSDNIHQTDGLPWLTHAAVTAMAAETAMTEGNVSELGMLPVGSRDLAGAAAIIYGLLSQTGGVLDLIEKLRGTAPSVNLTDVSADLDARLTTIEGETSTLPNKYLPFDGATWSLSAESDWDTALAWNVPADAYVISVTTAPGFRPTTDVAGFTWQPRLAWWAPWNGLQAGERHFIDFPASVLQDGSNRQPGILLYSEGGGAGHIQAWLRP